MSHRAVRREPSDSPSRKQHSCWSCSKCGKTLSGYDQVGYDGPAQKRSGPQEWLVLCNVCARLEEGGCSYS